MTLLDDPTYAEQPLDVDPGPKPQSRLSRLLVGDKSKKGQKRRRRRRTAGLWPARAMRFLLFVSLAIGVIGGAKALLLSPQPTPATDPANAAAPIVEAPRDIGVGGFAELYVSAWLGAGRENNAALMPYYSTPVDLTAVRAGRLWASRTAVIDVEEVADDYWAITVAADVLVADEEGAYQPGGIRYYTVAVVKTDDGFGASGLPAQIPPPATLEAPTLVIDVLEHPHGDLEPLAEALGGFFDALLAGSGELERYVSPETSLAPISPAPFATTEIRSLGARPETEDPTRYLIRVEVLASDAAGNGQILQYTAVLAQRAERWEVSELVAASPTDIP